MHARRDPVSAEPFFSLPSLRGICEDLIVLNCVKRMPPKDREDLIQLLMDHAVHSGIKSQAAFFSASRPQQPVLRVKDPEARIKSIEPKIWAIWNRNSWPNSVTWSDATGTPNGRK